MTIEEILESSADELEKMSDDELLKHFQQYLCVTRPEQAAKVRKVNEPQPVQIYLSPAKKAALDMLRDNGVDMSFMTRRKRK